MYRRLFGRRPQVQQQIRILTPHEKQLLITTLRHMTQPEHHITDLPLEAIGVFWDTFWTRHKTMKTIRERCSG